MVRQSLGSLEIAVLALLQRPPAEAYGVALRDALLERGRDISIGALYTCLERMQKKGFVSSKWGEATPERGGRRKRLFQIEAKGRLALIENQASTAWVAGQLASQG